MTGFEKRSSQTRRLVQLLRSRSGQWVPLPEILALHIAMYNTRIWEARHEWGLQIENKTETLNGQKRSWYRLVETGRPTSTVLAPPPTAEVLAQSTFPPPEHADLFPDLLPPPSLWRDPEEG